MLTVKEALNRYFSDEVDVESVQVVYTALRYLTMEEQRRVFWRAFYLLQEPLDDDLRSVLRSLLCFGDYDALLLRENAIREIMLRFLDDDS